MKRSSFAFAAAIAYLSLIAAAFAIDSCQSLNSANTIYTLDSDVLSNGTCFTISASNITLDGAGHSITYAITGVGKGVDIWSYRKITLKNLRILQNNAGIADSYAILGSGMSESTIINNTIITVGGSSYGIKISSSSNNTLSGNHINTSGTWGYGIYLSSSTQNLVFDNIINTSGSTGFGIQLDSASNTNNIINNIVATSGTSGYGISLDRSNSSTISGNRISTTGADGWGVRLFYASGNNITGGSIATEIGPDYHLWKAGAANRFENTGFIGTRTIYFNDASSRFIYNNETGGSVWLETNISAAGPINRSLSTWSQAIVQWNDAASPATTARYAISGLTANTQYRIYNSSGGASENSYNLTTGAEGSLPEFTIRLAGNTEIKAVDATSPAIFIGSPTNGAHAASAIWLNITLNEAGSWAGYSLDGASNVTLENSSGNWNAINSSMAEGLHTVIFYANDTAGNINETSPVNFTVDITAPSLAVNNPDENYSSSLSSIIFSFTASDNISRSMNCSLEINNSANMTNIAAGNNSETMATITGFEDGTWLWNVNCSDGAGNSIESAQRMLVIDTIPPAIYLAYPTPENGSVISQDSVAINATFSEKNPAACILEWGGTNYTMPISGTSCHIEMSGQPNGIKNYVVYMNDTAGNANVSGLLSITVSKPSAAPGPAANPGWGSTMPACGNNRCEPLETKQNCPADCAPKKEKIEKECKENWSCTEWSKCDAKSNSRNRICTDLNSCNTFLQKPEETSLCAPSAATLDAKNAKERDSTAEIRPNAPTGFALYANARNAGITAAIILLSAAAYYAVGIKKVFSRK